MEDEVKRGGGWWTEKKKEFTAEIDEWDFDGIVTCVHKLYSNGKKKICCVANEKSMRMRDMCETCTTQCASDAMKKIRFYDVLSTQKEKSRKFPILICAITCCSHQTHTICCCCCFLSSQILKMLCVCLQGREMWNDHECDQENRKKKGWKSKSSSCAEKKVLSVSRFEMGEILVSSKHPVCVRRRWQRRRCCVCPERTFYSFSYFLPFCSDYRSDCRLMASQQSGAAFC